jgi:hypothetical protein
MRGQRLSSLTTPRGVVCAAASASAVCRTEEPVIRWAAGRDRAEVRQGLRGLRADLLARSVLRATTAVQKSCCEHSYRGAVGPERSAGKEEA